MDEDDATFARRLFQAMRAVAREAGHPAAHPDTPAGRLAALRQQLRALDEDRWWSNDVQRGLILRDITRAQADRAS